MEIEEDTDTEREICLRVTEETTVRVFDEENKEQEAVVAGRRKEKMGEGVGGPPYRIPEVESRNEGVLGKHWGEEGGGNF